MSQSDAAIKHIGNYHLLDLVGKSDLSEVYSAEHSENHELVAIKILYGRWEESEAQKFFQQIETMQQLQHPHIIPIFDSGITDEGIAFIVMKYASKGSLRQLHPRGTRIPLETIVNYVNQITSALSYIHEQGLVHRDIKPHNLLMDNDDQIMLIDFGAATISHSIHPVEASQREFEGTVPYAAPEQLRGKSRRNSDQYALGIMVYEWITGNWPFDGTFHEMTHQHLFVSPPRFQERNIICPTNIEQVVRRTLEKDPAKRFPNVKSFAEEFEWACKVAQARGQTLSLANPAGTANNNTAGSGKKETETRNARASYATETSQPERHGTSIPAAASAQEPTTPDPVQTSHTTNDVESNLAQIIQSIKATNNNQQETETAAGSLIISESDGTSTPEHPHQILTETSRETETAAGSLIISESDSVSTPEHPHQVPTETSPAKSRNQFKSPKPFGFRETQ